MGLAYARSSPDALFDRAVEQLGSVSREESIKAFEVILSQNGAYAPAYNELAKLYLEDYSVDGRQRAEQTIQKAIQLDRKNPQYQLTLGKILWSQGFREKAFDQYKKIIDKHSKNTQALDGAGMFLVYDFLAMKDEPKSRDRDFSGFTKKVKKEAAKILLKSIELDGKTQTPYYLLGMLYFEDQRFDAFDGLMTDLRTQYPTDKNALLFRGLAQYQLGRFNEASQYYDQALELMSAEERDLMESIDLIAPETDDSIPRLNLSQNGSQAGELSTRDKFWKQQDPLYLSDFNERKLEHFGRMAYANLRFRRFSEAMEGWQTDMGKTWIKFGKHRHRRSSRVALGETWFYETFKISFRGNGSDIWSFGGGTGSRNIDMRLPKEASAFRDSNAVKFAMRQASFDDIPASRLEETSDRVFKKTEQRFVDPYLNRKHTLPYMIAAFQEADSVRVELSYMIPRDLLKQDPQSGEVSFWDGLFLFDDGWKETYANRKPASFAMPPVKTSHNSAEQHRNNHLLVWRSLHVPKGKYHLAVELLDQTSGAIGVARDSAQFLFEDNTFHLSDLLVASNIQGKNGFPERREDLVITPNPVRTFSSSESIFIYLELYDLKQDEFGRTKYEISYSISKPEVDVISPELFASQKVVDMLGETEIDVSGIAKLHHTEAEGLKIKKSEGEDVMRTVAAEYEGNKENDFTYLQIDMNPIPAGIYQLTVVAKDTRTDSTDTRAIYFKVAE